jgi:hypothetical protein
MSDLEKNVTANLEFFNTAILLPALRDHLIFSVGEASSTVSDFGAIEAAHWAWLGVQVGYFDAKDAHELISSSEGIFKAWTNLRDRQIVSPKDDWASVFQIGESGEATLNKELFSTIEEVDIETRELLQSTFQTFLLLTAENIFDNDSRYFLDGIGWTDDEEWNARKGGTIHQQLGSVQSGSVQQIGTGFANVLNYWEEMDSSSLSVRDKSRVKPELHQRKRDIGIRATGSIVPAAAVLNFTENARAISSRRFNLGQIEVVNRYFALAGEFANRAVEDSPEWLDARLRVFERLIFLITYAGGVPIEGHTGRLWNVFTRGVDGSSSEHEAMPIESSRETEIESSSDADIESSPETEEVKPPEESA